MVTPLDFPSYTPLKNTDDKYFHGTVKFRNIYVKDFYQMNI